VKTLKTLVYDSIAGNDGPTVGEMIKMIEKAKNQAIYEVFTDYESNYDENSRLRAGLDHLTKRTQELKEDKVRLNTIIDWALKGAQLIPMRDRGAFTLETTYNWCKANLKGEFHLERQNSKIIVGAFFDKDDAVKFKLFHG
jgi:hypothetical protein